MILNNYINILTYEEYKLSILLLNIYIYVFFIFTIFSLFFIFDIKFIKTLTDLKNMNYFESITLMLLLNFLSLAGIPPLLGFGTKLLLYILYISSSNYFLVFIYTIFNFFVMFFYIQNMRFVISNNPRYSFIFKSNYIYFNKKLLIFIILLNLIVTIGFINITDLIIFINGCMSYLF